MYIPKYRSILCYYITYIIILKIILSTTTCIECDRFILFEGDPGPQGSTGPTGLAGPSGSVGDNGPTGLSGSKGKDFQVRH